jgi:hypothetical protein
MKRFLPAALVLWLTIASTLGGCGGRKAAPPAGAPGIESAHGQAGPPAAAPGAGDLGGMPVMGAVPQSGSPSSAAGLTWAIPSGWSVGPPHSMRVATYGIPPAGGDAESASCAVYYFGAGQGGGVDANLSRWVGQFQPATRATRSTRDVHGIRVSLADAAGTYTAHGGSMMQPQGDRPGWRLLGAIAEGPQGAVFFKLTGSEKTVAAARGRFDGMIGSLKKE